MRWAMMACVMLATGQALSQEMTQERADKIYDRCEQHAQDFLRDIPKMRGDLRRTRPSNMVVRLAELDEIEKDIKDHRKLYFPDLDYNLEIGDVGTMPTQGKYTTPGSRKIYAIVDGESALIEWGIGGDDTVLVERVRTGNASNGGVVAFTGVYEVVERRPITNTYVLVPFDPKSLGPFARPPWKKP